jgi:NDP-sugar pyrophosphorylase family protein
MRDIGAIILAGNRDFGRCPLASRLPLPLWPVLGTPALRRLLDRLSADGVKHIAICSKDELYLKQCLPDSMDADVQFVKEDMSLGTAGCIRDAAVCLSQQLLVVMSASIISPPPVDLLIKNHCEGCSELSVVLNPPPADATSAGIYVCDRAILEHIPEHGYCDIKEWLVPEMLRHGKVVKYIELTEHVGDFRDGPGYLRALADYLERGRPLDTEVPSLKRGAAQGLWVDESAMVDPTARFFGPVVVLGDAVVAEKAAVFGPTVIGRGVRVGQGSLLVASAIWDGSRVGKNCEIQRCLIDFDQVVPDNVVLNDKSVASQSKSSFGDVVERAIGGRQTDESANAGKRKASGGSAKAPTGGISVWQWVALGLVLAAFLWSYWLGIVDLLNIWQKSDEYSSGLLVPFLAVYILWSKRKQIAGVRIQPSLWGLLAFVGAQAVRFFGLFFMYGSAERLSVVLSIAALVLLLFGWCFFRKVFPVMLFLFLMLPWPNRVQAAVALPLQRWATSSAVFCLEVVGYEVTHEGNIIHIGQASVAVAEACNGFL